MFLPEELQQAIEAEVEPYGWQEMTEAREDLTDRYRQRTQKGRFMSTEAHRYSYVVTRMPATYAVVVTVLEEIKARLPDLEIKSVLDLGAGPGTAMWAASEVFPSIQKITLIEQDDQLMALGKRLASYSQNPAIATADWQPGNLEALTIKGSYDLIILSYSVGELSTQAIPKLMQACWDAGQLLVVIEPGTPKGFGVIHDIRTQLIALQSHMVAPCPHTVACPMAQAGDWCHFAARVDRSFLHRRLKGGTLPYEDEKFSYVSVSKFPAQLPQTRVLRPPLKRSGHVCLTLCTAEGLKHETVSKRSPELYKQAKKLEWGSVYPSI